LCILEYQNIQVLVREGRKIYLEIILEILVSETNNSNFISTNNLNLSQFLSVLNKAAIGRFPFQDIILAVSQFRLCTQSRAWSSTQLQGVAFLSRSQDGTRFPALLIIFGRL